MKVLLLGEFSSLHKYLKDGVQKIDNIEVTLVSQGDGWKNIPGADMSLPVYSGRNIFMYVIYLIRYLKSIKKIKGYDIVQIINTGIFPSLVSNYLIRWIKKNNRAVVLIAAGEDYPLYKSYKEGILSPYIFDYTDEFSKKYSCNDKRAYKRINNELEFVKCIDVVIPSLYEYSVGYQGMAECVSVIPFPINIDIIEYQENKVVDRIVFFHGLNREESKGTKFIKEALMRLKKNYPDDVEVIIDGHMPFDKYTEVLKKSNVVVDQCLTYGYGINACISMAQGKVVMSSCRKETLDAFGLESSPIINILPDVDVIYKEMEKLVLNKGRIEKIGKLSREYIENNHDYLRISKCYVDIWNSLLEKKGEYKNDNAK